MSKFSVKKPLTVFVAVIAVLVLGVVAYLNMTPDLLPNMDFPYVIIMTTYPGASPEKVEQEITKPMEQSMSTLEHIKEVTSTSSENYSMLMLEFEDSVNMDTIGVDIQQSITALSAQWDDMVGTPYVLKINPSLLPVEVAAVAMDGMNTVQLTEFLNGTLLNKLEGISGVARVSASGLITRELHVILDQAKIDALNQSIANAINSQLDDASQALTDKKAELVDAQNELQSAQEQLDSGKNALAHQMAAGEAELSQKQNELLAAKAQLQEQKAQLESGKTQLEATLNALLALQSGLNELESQYDALFLQLDTLKQLHATAQTLQTQQDQYDAQIQSIQNDPALTQEQKDAQTAAILSSAEYVQLQASRSQLDAQLAANGVSVQSLPAQIAVMESSLNALDARITELEQLFQEQGIGKDALDAKITEMQANLTALNDGIAQINDAMIQLDSGMLQLKDASLLLSTQKTLGLLELSNAATEIAVGNSTLTAALAQIEGGLDTVQTSREEALSQADLTQILTMDMVGNLLTAQSFSMPAGYVEQDGISYMVSVGNEITQLEELQVLLLFDMGIEGVDPIYLTDVAALMVTDNRNETYARLNGSDSIMLSFEKQSTYATAETTNNIEARFRELEKEYPGLEFVALMNQGDYIYLIVDTITSSLLLGAVFAILILLLFLKDLRPTFITLCSIPISVIFAIVLMYFSGVTINMISLSGLAVAVGMLVDNSVVVIENIYRLRAKGANVIQAAVSGAGQVAGAVTASTLTTVCVFLPIVFVQGITRQLFTDLALTMTYSLLASLIVSLTLVPAMASGMLRKEGKPHKQSLMDGLLRAYTKAAAWSLDHKAAVLILSAVILVLSAALSLSRGFIFMPEMDMPNVNVSVTMPEDVTMEEAAALADQVLERIDTVDGIETVGAMMSSGNSLLGGSSGSYDVTIYITLSDENAKGSVVGRQITELCADLPCKVSSSSAMMDMSMLTGSGISLQIYADDMQTLQNAAVSAAATLEGLDGIGEISNGLEEAVPALHVRIDRNAAMSKGLTVAQIYMELAAALQNSTTLASMELEGTTTSVIVEKPKDTVLTANDLASYSFEVTGRDGSVSSFLLKDVAKVEETTSLSSISRLNQRRYLTVSATVLPGYNVTLLTGQAEQLLRNADLGEGVSYVFTGENETIMESVEQLGLMLILGVLLVYLVMVAQFQSLKSPFIVMFTIPLAFSGGFLALLICNMEVSVVSLIGFIMLTGIIVNNGIVLVDYINQLRMDGTERREAILEAGKTRMRPILMTSITTILGLIDMAVNASAGTALMRPVAVVCIGGLLYATLMTLFVVPCIYDMVSKKPLRNVRDEDLKLLDL